MKKQDLIKQLQDAELNSRFTLRWDRGNGAIGGEVYFNGFDENKNPLLFLINNKNVCLDLDKIGGYSSIISLTPYENN